ncbi:MAG TPA: PilZ domain-containing protein [Pseudolabrys sp.]|nr:PilZ domain-containing protein [Pseudolabrys sp.]
MAVNKRRAKRQRIRYPAWVMPTPDQRIDCFVTDVSEVGARIQVDDAESVPDCFGLLLSNNGAPRRFCRAIWRKPHEIGVKFARTFADAASMKTNTEDHTVPAPLVADEPANVT